MVRLNMIVEGQTEETFVRDTLRPSLAESGIYVCVRIANAKATAGPLVAAIIGLPLMLERCPHFA